MKIVQFDTPGEPDVLNVVEVPEPIPEPGEVKVVARAIGVGATDVALRRGVYPWNSGFPATPGIELAGVIEAAGKDVAPEAIGRPVLVSAREGAFRGGCYAEKIVVTEQEVFYLPESIDLLDAATLANAQVAWHLLEQVGSVKDKRVVVMGAAGGIGGMIVQLAKLAGAQVLGVVSSDERGASARRSGADEVVVAAADHATEVSKRWSAADVVVDHLFGPSSVNWIEILKLDGTLLIYGAQTGCPGEELAKALLNGMQRNVGIRFFSMHSLDHQAVRRRADMEHLIHLLDRGDLHPEIGATYPLVDAVEAHRHFEERSTHGKILLVP